MTLFKSGDFTLHSGNRVDWIIDCNFLSSEDINTLALIGSKILPPFGTVLPVMRGGLRLAIALSKYGQDGGRLLIAEDVVTTGQSMEDVRDGRDAIGICIFARGPVPSWVTPIWSLYNANHKQARYPFGDDGLGNVASVGEGNIFDESEG